MGKIQKLASANKCLPVTETLLQIWESDNEEALAKLDQTNQLLPMIESLIPHLAQAQDLRVKPANQNLATFEILQMAELPLHVPISAYKMYRLFVDDNFYYMYG